MACVPIGGCPGGVANVNTETFAAVNGNTLTITSQDVACPPQLTPYPPTRYHGTGHWAVTGGTGRFAGASGQGFFDGLSDFGAGTFVATLTGIIAFQRG